jgi:hypothetical protein
MRVAEMTSAPACTSSTTRVSKASCASSSSTLPSARGRSGSLAHADQLGAELRDEHVVDEVLRRACGERSVERNYDELADA